MKNTLSPTAAIAAALLLLAAALVSVDAKAKTCDKGWECSKSEFCCNETITDFFQVYQFENLFSKRNTPIAHAVGYWDYHSFITAAAVYEPLGFGTTGGKQMGMMEVAAFLGHVGSKTSCGYGVATGGPLAWGLCYNHEMSPSQSYCTPSLRYPCTPGADYYGRGALPVYWNDNYGIIGENLKIDLLNHPEYLEQNATMAFQAAIWRWMYPMKKKQPSAKKAPRPKVAEIANGIFCAERIEEAPDEPPPLPLEPKLPALFPLLLPLEELFEVGFVSPGDATPPLPDTLRLVST